MSFFDQFLQVLWASDDWVLIIAALALGWVLSSTQIHWNNRSKYDR